MPTQLMVSFHCFNALQSTVRLVLHSPFIGMKVDLQRTDVPEIEAWMYNAWCMNFLAALE